MTVVNVTNATLKGSVKGPTFTGDVDGATFTGAVTYTETTPPVEPPTTSTDGLITNFTGQNSRTFQIEGVNVEVQNANSNWCLQNPDKYTLRFEVRSGDHYSSSGWTDSTAVERSEIERWSQRYPPDRDITVTYGFLIEPGPNNTADWMVIGQMHCTQGGNPPCTVNMYGERMHVIVRNKQNTENRVYSDPNPIQRGHKYNMKLKVRFASSGNSRLQVWRDNTQIVDFTGAIGQGAGVEYYWKNGIYREKANETIAAKYSNLHFVLG